MKKYLFLIPVFALLTIPAISHAEDTSAGGTGPIGVIKTAVQTNLQNVRNNEDTRNGILRGASTTASTTLKQERQDIRDDRHDAVTDLRDDRRDLMKDATSSADRKEIRQDMRLDVFKVRLNALVSQLRLSLVNLAQIETRIQTVITRAEQNGRNMTDAKNALITADAKIQAAKTAVDALAAYVPTTTGTTATSTASTTPNVDLGKPRQIGAAAIAAVKAARDAFKAVVSAIAHNMGLGKGPGDGDKDHGTTTPPVSTSTPPVSTSTPIDTSTTSPSAI